MTDQSSLSELQKDILKEVANIGSGNAATALAGILGRQVNISTGKLQIVTIKNIEEVLGCKGEPAVGIYNIVSGGLKGGSLIYMNQANALLLTDLLSNRSYGTTLILTDDDRSMLKEVGLVLSVAYLDALSKLSGYSMVPGVPKLVYKRSEEIAGFIMNDLEHCKDSDEFLICIQTEFSQNDSNMPGDFLLFLNSESFKLLLNAIEKSE